MKKTALSFVLAPLLLAAAGGIFAQTSAQDQQKAMEARYVRKK